MTEAWVPPTNTNADIHKPTIAELNATGNLDLSLFATKVGSDPSETVDDGREAYAAVGEKSTVRRQHEGGRHHLSEAVGRFDQQGARLFRSSPWWGATTEEWAAGEGQRHTRNTGIRPRSRTHRQMSQIAFAADPSSSDEERCSSFRTIQSNISSS